MKRKISFLLAFVCVLASVSCGSTGGETDDTPAVAHDDTTSSTDAESAYSWPDVDLGGNKLSILNSSTTWGFYTTIDLDA